METEIVSTTNTLFTKKNVTYIGIGVVVIIVVILLIKYFRRGKKESYTSSKNKKEDQGEDKPIELSSTLLLLPLYKEGECLGKMGKKKGNILRVIESSTENIQIIMSDSSTKEQRQSVGKETVTYIVQAGDSSPEVTTMTKSEKGMKPVTVEETKSQEIINAITKYNSKLVELC